MNSPWPTVALGEVIEQRKEFVTIDDLATYKRCRVQLHAQGVVLRDEPEGARIKTKSQQVCHTDEFLVAEIDAKVGGFGIVPSELAGAIVSSHYFLFVIDQTRLDKRFLDYFIRTPDFQDQVNARGSTNYAAIRPHHVLAYEIPLPPLPEQRRIVARIETLAAKVEAARELREEAMAKTEGLFASSINEIWQNRKTWTKKTIGELATTVSGQVDPRIEPYASLPHINGTVIESGTCRLLSGFQLAKEDGVTSGKYHFRAGAILYSKIRPYLKKAVQVPFEGICSADVYAFEWIEPEIDPRFFMYSLVSPEFTNYANERSGRTRIPKLNQKQLFAFEMAYPPLPEQHRIVAHLDALQARLALVQQHQTATQSRLDALLPSILDRAFKGEL